MPKERRFVAIEDFIPAGMELVNFRLATEEREVTLSRNDSPPYERGVRGGSQSGSMSLSTLRPDAEESHDDRLFLFQETLPAGMYEYDYYVRALIPGRYHHLPAVVSEMYFPENFGRTRGGYFTVGNP